MRAPYFPNLFEATVWPNGPTTVEFFTHEPPSENLIRVYCCKVRLTCEPQIPEEGGEQIALVKAMSLVDAMKCFESIQRTDLAELYQFASETIT